MNEKKKNVIPDPVYDIVTGVVEVKKSIIENATEKEKIESLERITMECIHEEYKFLNNHEELQTFVVESEIFEKAREFDAVLQYLELNQLNAQELQNEVFRVISYLNTKILSDIATEEDRVLYTQLVAVYYNINCMTVELFKQLINCKL